MKKNVLTAVTAVAIAAFALTGCSSQSVDAGCNELKSTFESINKKGQDMSSDPSKFASVLKDFETEMSDAAKKITNEEVKANVDALAKSFGEYNKLIADAGSDLSKLSGDEATKISDSIQKSADAIDKQCNLKLGQ